MARITNGYDKDVDVEWLAEHLFEFKPFDVAAPMIDPEWKRHHIHKEIKANRVFPSELLIVYDSDAYKLSQGKKFYISDNEIARLREDVETRTKRKLRKCLWCPKPYRYCIINPCDERIKRLPENRDRAEKIAALAERLIETAYGKRKRFTKIDGQG